MIQTGAFSTQSSAGEVVAIPVTFPKVFNSAPKVVAAALTTHAEQVSISIDGVSTSGFTAYIYRTITWTTGVSWIAIGV